MNEIYQLIISGIGIGITIGIIYGGQRRLGGIIEERLRASEERFKHIEIDCNQHHEKIGSLEVQQAHHAEQLNNHQRRIEKGETE